MTEKEKQAPRRRKGSVKIRSGFGKAYDMNLPKRLRSRQGIAQLHAEAEAEWAHQMALKRAAGLGD